MRFRSPTEATRAGLGFVPEDRRVQNIVPDLSVKENLLLAHLGAHKGFGLGYRQNSCNPEERCDLTTVIVPVLNRRGHEQGHIGLRVTGRDVPSPVNEIQRALATLPAICRSV